MLIGILHCHRNLVTPFSTPPHALFARVLLCRSTIWLFLMIFGSAGSVKGILEYLMPGRFDEDTLAKIQMGVVFICIFGATSYRYGITRYVCRFHVRFACVQRMCGWWILLLVSSGSHCFHPPVFLRSFSERARVEKVAAGTSSTTPKRRAKRDD